MAGSPLVYCETREGQVVLLPDLGSVTIESRMEVGDKVIVNICTFMNCHMPSDRVLPSML
jgi:glyoxylate reductase